MAKITVDKHGENRKSIFGIDGTVMVDGKAWNELLNLKVKLEKENAELMEKINEAKESLYILALNWKTEEFPFKIAEDALKKIEEGK